MSIVISENGVPEGFRHLEEKEIIDDYLSFDIDENGRVSKNEWILTFAAMFAKNIKDLEKDGPDCVMTKLTEIANEFDKYDSDGSGYLEYKEYKDILLNNVFISE
ncbi:hypothetical protein IJ579_08075 [bacterium]|nr:hypothetical protein [bacterium]